MGSTSAPVRTAGRLFVVAAMVASLVIATAATAAVASSDDDTYAAQELDFIARINGERTRQGHSALTLNLQLTRVARSWSDQMAAARGISHNPQVANQVEGDWTRLGENVGYSTRSATTPTAFVERLHEAFMASPGHRANVLGDFNQVGVGVRMTGATMWVTVNFVKAATVVPNGTVSEASRVAGRVFAPAGRGRHSADYVVVTASDQPAHAMGGAALAGDSAPLLYTHPATRWDPNPVLHPTTRAQVDRVLGGRGLVYVVGGAKAVSKRAVRELARDGYTVKRLNARSVPATLVRVAEETVRRRGSAGGVLIGSRSDSGSSVAAAVWAARSGTPFLVTGRRKLHPAVRDFLARHRPAKRWVVGSPKNLGKAVKEAAGARRIGGKTNSAVSVKVAKRLWRRTSASNGDRWASTPGFDRNGWAYTLAYASWSAVNDGPALLVGSAEVPPKVRRYLANMNYGGAVQGSVEAPNAVPRPVVNHVRSLVSEG